MVFVTGKQKVDQHASLTTSSSPATALNQPSKASRADKKEDSSMTASKISDRTPDSSISAVVKTKNSTEEQGSKNETFVYHIVQPGDTLWNIAKRYQGVTVEELKSLNQLVSNELKPGTRLKVIIGG